MSPRLLRGPDRDLQRFGPVRRLVGLRAFQFALVLPTALVVAVVLISAAAGIEHPQFNFGTVFTWVVWWGALLLALVVLGRAWCLACPVGAVVDWIQRLSPWWRSRYAAGYNLRWPRRLRNLWLPTGSFLVFIWLDNGYGISNSPRMTAGLVAVLLLAAAWTALFFERRAFCRYVCPLTAFIGLNALSSMFELRQRDAEACRSRCPGKECYRGSAEHYGCPMGEFPGGGMDTNLYCILCTECLKSCPHDNLALRFRVPGADLWGMRRLRLDGAFAATVVVGVATILPLVMLALLPGVRGGLARLLPPGDAPRLVAVGLLFGLGVGVSAGLVHLFSRLARLAAGDGAPSARDLFAGSAYGLIPIGLSKYAADLLEHLLRTWGALDDVTRALMLDFPFNRAIAGRVTAAHLLAPVPTYLLQVGLLLGGLLFSLVALRRISVRLAGDRDAAFASFLVMAGLAFLFTLVGLWTLGAGLL